MSEAFFQRQLLILGGYCIGAVLLDRWITSKMRNAARKVYRGPPNKQINQEEGIRLTAGGPRMNNGLYEDQNSPESSSLAQKYLVVYGLVMGTPSSP